MSLLAHRFMKVLLAATVVASTAQAASNNPHVSVQPQARIVDQVDNTKVNAVPNSHPARISSLVDSGRVPANTQLSHMMLVLKPSDEQEFALHALLDQQQDRAHANYHQWMTPETFGSAFGVASADIAQVKAWLQNSGFTVDSVAKGARIITFSGTSGQVEAAFHTEMHQYVVNGEMRMSNSTDISIPKALSEVVVGPAALNNFRPTHSLHALHVTTDNQGNVIGTTPFGAAPATSVPGSQYFPSGHFVGGADLATIYDTAPLFAKGIQGQGVTLGIIGQTDVLQSDIQLYRSIFGLPLNNFTRMQIGNDPGIIADDGESDLDLEVSGAMAPLANQIFYTSGNGYFGGGIDSSMEYVIEDNAADIISESYGECESALGSNNAFYNYIYEQAAAQGQSIFISTGDDGPDTCGTYYNAKTGTGGYSVNGLGSTPFNVAVGGTQFNEGATYNTAGAAAPYWGPYSTAAPYESALTYIPDQPWNESVFGTGTYGGLTGGGSGISFYYQTPSWQVGPGVPTTDPNPPAGSYEATIPAADFVVPGPHRYLPDVSLNAAVYHDGTIFCSEASCTLSSTGGLNNFGIVGGTSVAAPTMAGAQALINQMNGGRQGVPNYYYYRLAAVQSATNCVASAYVATAGCSFHDSQVGNNDVPAVAGSTTQEIGWNAGPQYDLAVGLDSPDVANMATNWSKVTFNATTTTLTLTPTTGTPGGTYNATVKVAPASGSGTPTGDVSIIAQALFGGVGFFTLSNGTASGALTGLPGGTYNVYAHYAGSTVYGGSNSAPIKVTISTAAPTLQAASYLLGTNASLTPTSTFTYGTNVFIQAGLVDPNTAGTPTGTITFALNNGTALTPYTTGVDPNGFQIVTNGPIYSAGAYFDAGLGLTRYDIAPTYPVLPPGTYTASVTYSGDTTFTAATATPFTFVVGPAASAITLRAASADVTSGSTVTLTATITQVAAAAGGAIATGTVTFTDTTTSKVLGSGTLTNGTVTFTTNGLTTSGAHAITATYGGDANYGAVTSTATTVTVTTGAATSITLVANPTTAPVGTTVALTATVPSATSGTVTFFDGGLSIGTATVGSAGTATLSIKTFVAGIHPITATYGGTAALASSTTTSTTTVTVTQNLPTVSLSSPAASAHGAPYAMEALLLPTPNNVGTTAPTPPPTGNIQFLDGTTVLGTAVATYQPGGYEDYVANYTTTALTPGYHMLSAKYVGDANYAAATSNTQPAAIGITTTAVVSSTTNVGTGIVFTLTATITPLIPNTPAIGGTVTFKDGTTVIGTAPVINGVATLTTATLSGVGTHNITAVYSGDANYYTSTSTTSLSIVTETPNFTLTVNPTSLTITRGNSGTATLTSVVTGNYNGFGSFSCSGLPAYTYCTFSQPAMLFVGDNSTQTATVTITTLAPAKVSGGNAAGLLWLPAMLLAAFLGLRRKQLSLLGRQMMVIAILLCGTMAVSGCGSNAVVGSPTGTSNVVITANGNGSTSASPNINPTATIALTIQ